MASALLSDLGGALQRLAATFRLHFWADHAVVVLDPGVFGVAGAIASEVAGDAWLQDWMENRESCPAGAHVAIDPVLVDPRAEPGEPWIPAEAAAELRSVIRTAICDRMGQAIGFAGLASREADAFDEAAALQLRELAALAGVCIERVRSFAEVSRERTLLECEARILAAGSVAESEEELAELAASGLREALGAEHGMVVTLSAGGRRGLSAFAPPIAPSDGLRAAMRDAGNEPLLGFARHGGYLNLDLRRSRPTPVEHGIHQWLGMRSLAVAVAEPEGGPRLVLAAAAARPFAWNEPERAFIARLATVVSMNLDRVRRGERLRAQRRAMAALAPGSSIEAVAGLLVEEARREFEATFVAAHVLEEGLPRAVGFLGTQQLALNDRVLRSAAYKGLLAGRPSVAPVLDGTGSPAEAAEHAAGMRSVMRLPLVTGTGAITGFVVVGSDRSGAYSEESARRLGELCSALAVVAERARLVAEGEERARKVQTLERLLAALNASTSPDEVARAFVRRLGECTNAELALVHSFDPVAGGQVLAALDSGDEEPAWKESSRWSDRRWLRIALADRTALFDRARPQGTPEWVKQGATDLRLATGAWVRLDGSNGPVGMIGVGSREGRRMGEEELNILAETAAPLAMVLERARTLEALQRQTQHAEAVVRVLAALGAGDSIDAVARTIGRAIRDLYDADLCTVGIIDGAGITLFPDAPDSQPIPLALADIGIEGASAPPQFQVTPDIDDGDWPAPKMKKMLAGLGMASGMAALFSEGGQISGLVSVFARARGRFTGSDASELARVVQPIPVAMSHFRARTEAEARAQRLEYTNRILTGLSAGGSPEDLAGEFLQQARAMFGASYAVALRFDTAEGRAVRLARSSAYNEDAGLPPSAPLQALRTARFLYDRTPVVIRDAREDEPPGPVHESMLARGIYSSIRAPITLGDTVYGAVSLWGRGVGRFSRDDANLLAALTSPLGVALSKAAALRSLAESENKFRSLVDQAEEMILLFDAETHTIAEANSCAARALGYEESAMVGLLFDDIAGESATATNVQAVLDKGEVRLNDTTFVRRDGRPLVVDVVASSVAVGGRLGVLVLARDVTETRGLQRQLVQAQKMESLGVMAGAIAHDFNNLLTTILGFAGILKRSPQMAGEDRENLGLIEDAARHAADLTSRLLSFARGGLVRFGPMDLRDVVNDTLHLASPTLHQDIALSVALPDRPVKVEGDQGQLQQALLNIVLNARDAMPEGGAITIGLQAATSMATLTVADNGPGMPDEVRTRIFEPFFTTKPPGTGTGLGLAITYGIVQGHHGAIAVESAEGKGTTFVVTLPLLADESALRPLDSFSAAEGDLVLVVDDDDLVRRATSATLAHLGYNVVEASNGATAVELLRARPERFAAIMLDLVMPGMNGSEVFRAMAAIRNDLPVIICTGYAADEHIDTDVKRRIAGLIQKPFSGERLARALLAVGARPGRR